MVAYNDLSMSVKESKKHLVNGDVPSTDPKNIKKTRKPEEARIDEHNHADQLGSSPENRPKKIKRDPPASHGPNGIAQTNGTEGHTVPSQAGADPYYLSMCERRRKCSWGLSNSTSSSNIRHKPLFTKGNKYLIIPTKSSLKLYSTQTGSCVQKVDLHFAGQVSCACIDPTNMFRVWVASRKGEIKVVDWTDGSVLYDYSVDCRPLQLVIRDPGVFYVVSEHSTKSGGSNAGYPELLQANVSGDPTVEVQLKQIAMLPRSPIGVYFQEDWRKFIVQCRKKVVVGAKRKSSWDHKSYSMVKDISYFACFGSTLACGDIDGRILIYEDVFSEKALQNPRTLHWHSQTVYCLCWALSGQYLLSGGEENVLVLWNMETGHKQFLPRLGSPLQRISVSEDSKTYAILMKDNSCKVINAIDLELRAEISGLIPIKPRIPVCAHTNGNMFLGGAKDVTKASTIHVYDVLQERNISKVEVSKVNHIQRSGSEGVLVRAPDVQFIASSTSQDRLATVDFWKKGKRSTDSNTLDESTAEIFLKFWKWEEMDKRWILTTRIDSPHGEGVSILALKESTNQTFLSLGKDGTVRVWAPRLKRASSSAPVNEIYTCNQIIRYPKRTPAGGECSGAMSVSKDGSLVALSVSRDLCLIDRKTGSVLHHQPNLTHEDIVDIVICKDNLVAASSCSVVSWSVAKLTPNWVVDVRGVVELAVSEDEALVGVAINKPSNAGFFAIYDPLNPYALFSQALTQNTAALTFANIKGQTESLGPCFIVVQDSSELLLFSQSNATGSRNELLGAIDDTDAYDTLFQNRESTLAVPVEPNKMQVISPDALLSVNTEPSYNAPDLTSMYLKTLALYDAE